MHKIAPGSISRLQALSALGPRFYRASVYVRRLETLGLVAATGRSDPSFVGVEYEIADAGCAELEEQYVSFPTRRIKS
ncbi:hypothetical protein MKK63_09450 [Methylobacterium sp. J-088]|uniref:hypothetical protein n=1 Tax=Methylobacterium sp. J-088 TaxID=2836664 RepID=UPI001FB97591|nr:hypothetical protein [Methylobacterium sp. J-088]MCJ2062934.1 hypothetical protein [Methylobacterium sp. J-088]